MVTSQHAQGDGWTPKGLPPSGVSTGWSIFDNDVTYPIAVMFDSAIAHNSAALAAFCERHGVSLAPHGKTTMSPTLFRRQLGDGAWAITAATCWQARTMWAAGVPRVLIANQVVVPGEIRWLAEAQAAGLEVYCYVDSLTGVEILHSTLAELGTDRPLPVLLEVGFAGGRTGTRTMAAALEVAAAAHGSSQLALTGTSGFEGIVPSEAVEGFLSEIVDVTHAVASNGWFEPTPDVIVSAGGSAYFDRVVSRFAEVRLDQPTRVVIRSGCYITHDDGLLHAASPMGRSPRTGHDEHLIPALEVWGAVLSRPEPTRAIVGIGKRDASTDGLLPLLKKVRRRGSALVEHVPPIRVVDINDQHAFVDLDPENALAVGDLVGFGISHPCTTFDKWRAIPIVDDDYRVVEISETQF